MNMAIKLSPTQIKIRIILYGMIAGLFLAPCVFANDTSNDPTTTELLSKKLSLKECTDLALKKNRARTVSNYSIKIAEAQHKQALSAYWPQIGAKASYSIMDQDPNFIFPKQNISMPQGTSLLMQVATPGGPVTMPISELEIPEQNVKLMDRKNLVASLNTTIPLYTGGKISAIARQAKQGIKTAKEEARRTDLQVIYDTTRYYYGAVLARQLVQIGTNALLRMEVTLDLTENLYTTGSGKVMKTDYLRNKVFVEWLRTAVITLESNQMLANAALANAIGLDWKTPVEPETNELPFIATDIELHDLVNNAYNFNPDWKRLEAGIEATRAKIDEAKSGNLPTIALFGNLSRIENSYDKGIVTSDNRNSWLVGIGIEFPLFNGLRTTNKIVEAKAQFSKLKQQQFILKDGLALQVKHIFIQLMSYQKQKASSEAAAIASEENRSLNERAYQAEMVETKDMLEAQMFESLMKAQYQKSLYNHLEARANLDFIVGQQLTESFAVTEL